LSTYPYVAFFPSNFARFQFRLRARKGRNGCVVHRFLHRLFVVLVGHLAVVFQGDVRGVSHPRRHHVHRKPLGQFRFSGRS